MGVFEPDKENLRQHIETLLRELHDQGYHTIAQLLEHILYRTDSEQNEHLLEIIQQGEAQKGLPCTRSEAKQKLVRLIPKLRRLVQTAITHGFEHWVLHELLRQLGLV